MKVLVFLRNASSNNLCLRLHNVPENMRHLKLTVSQEQNGALSLSIKDGQANIIGGGGLGINHDPASFYRNVARSIADCAAAGDKIDYTDMAN